MFHSLKKLFLHSWHTKKFFHLPWHMENKVSPVKKVFHSSQHMKKVSPLKEMFHPWKMFSLGVTHDFHLWKRHFYHLARDMRHFTSAETFSLSSTYEKNVSPVKKMLFTWLKNHFFQSEQENVWSPLPLSVSVHIVQHDNTGTRQFTHPEGAVVSIQCLRNQV